MHIACKPQLLKSPPRSSHHLLFTDLVAFAPQVAIAATGENKAWAVKVALEMPATESGNVLPVGCVDPFRGLVMWLLDEPAAAQLDMDESDDEDA